MAKVRQMVEGKFLIVLQVQYFSTLAQASVLRVIIFVVFALFSCGDSCIDRAQFPTEEEVKALKTFR